MKTNVKNVTFRFGVEDFKIQLNAPSTCSSVTAPSESSMRFFNFLKRIHLVDDDTDASSWFDSCDNLEFELSDNKTSFKIRKEATKLGLTIIPGKVFEMRKKEAVERAKEKAERCM